MSEVGELIGRAAETARLSALLDAVPEAGSSLVVAGDPGVGKTALLADTEQRALSRGWLVLRADGTPGERELPLAAIHRLLQPALPMVEALPDGDRQVLFAAFGLTDGPPPGLFRVALALLNLLTELATAAPVLVRVEDSHWLDRASAEVLAFVARRIDADPVLMIVSTRSAVDDVLVAAARDVVELRPLGEPESAALLATTGGDLAPMQRATVLRSAAGNPLALIELPRALREDHDQPLPMTARLEQAFAGRLSELPATARDLVLLAALSGDERLATLVSAAGTAGHADLQPALAAGLIDVHDEVVRFRHPLARSAVERAAPLDRRMAAHAALAGAAGVSPDRRAWHRANATLGPDESVAGELEAAGARAQARGALADAISAFERAADFSPSPVRRDDRLLRAAELAADAGQFATIDRLSARADLDGIDRLRVEALLEVVDDELRGGEARIDELLALADSAHRIGHAQLARRLLLRAGLRCWHVDFGGGPEARVLAAVDRLAGNDLDPSAIVVRAYAAPFTQADTVRALVTQPDRIAAAAASDLHLLGHAAACIGAFHEARRLCTLATDRLRQEGRLALLAQALRLQAWAAIRVGRWDDAASAAEEAARLGEETRQPVIRADALAALAMIGALRGDHEHALALGAQADGLAQRTANRLSLALIQQSRAMVAAGEGRPDEAFDLLIRVFRPGDPAHQHVQAGWAIGALAEYAVASGREDVARAEVAALEARLAGTPPSGGVLVALRYARASLAEPAEAEARFHEAVDVGDWPFDVARVRLALGTSLRRQRRLVEAREPLRAARDAFDDLGARGWAERARSELRATGEDSTRRAADAWDELTPQERQIARMVAQGLSNKEIAQRLYVSHRTVASHLYRMFPKLGVTSRAQVANAVAERRLEVGF